MPMNVILLERVPKLGQMGDVVKVKPGFARNFLLPQKKALRATKDNIAYFESQRKTLEAQNLERRKDAEAVATKMARKMTANSDRRIRIIETNRRELDLLSMERSVLISGRAHEQIRRTAVWRFGRAYVVKQRHTSAKSCIFRCLCRRNYGLVQLSLNKRSRIPIILGS